MMNPVKNVILNMVDVSYYQGNIDFVKMKNAGIGGVIIRAGYGVTVDKRFITYINDAIKAGLNIGIYWFIYAGNESISMNNAIKFEQTISPYKKYINCGVWADFEYDSDKKAGGTLSPSKRSAIVDKFNTYLASKGYEVGIYSNQDYIKSGKFTATLIAKYPLWFAKYSKPYITIYANKGKNNLPYIVQYTSSGDGIHYGVSSLKLDMDYGYFTISLNKEQESVVDKNTTVPEELKAKNNPYLRPTRTIYYDSKKKILYGDDVKWVQWHLWRFGLLLDKNGVPDKKLIDGYFGPQCDKATREAQKRLGLVIDGKVGPKTIAKFEQI